MATVVQYERLGGPEVLEVVEVPDPSAPAGGVVVRVRAAGVNPIDGKLRSGGRPSGPFTGPRVPGSDAAGTVVEVGDGVDDWAVGDEVVVRGARGGYASHLVADAAQLVRKPAGVTWEQAAAIGIPVSTAHQALRSLGLADGETLLVHGGSGAVGRAAVQFARRTGARVVATGSPAAHDRLRELGAIPVAYGDGLLERLREAAPQGYDRILDAVGSDEALETSFALVDDRSRIGTVVVGGRAADLGIQAWAGGNPVPLTAEQTALREEAYPLALDLIARREFEVDIARTFPLAEAAEAARLVESGHPGGKVILLP
ncbi:NADP-dependent oxidoreductase [Leifsonia sp. ZF2019]|uniref:NADP-dependent oxidoreductase n=1 Tax=Leifsonia sp. ZF2019 TaxID=2781978 RepID=UPI001CC152C7|nr:NADP-dependent oxidoreductase [Leifsonia sp. ZF2019]UAJ79918.1 NADP-dependent oxidoreductase [Leifsonia sp. ZF2019]